MNIIIDFVVEILATNVWQLIGIMFGLLILKQVKADIRPIFLGMVGPLTKQAQSNAAAWAVGIMLGHSRKWPTPCAGCGCRILARSLVPD